MAQHDRAFIPSTRFVPRPGYVFTTGSQGLGFYVSKPPPSIEIDAASILEEKKLATVTPVAAKRVPPVHHFEAVNSPYYSASTRQRHLNARSWADPAMEETLKSFSPFEYSRHLLLRSTADPAPAPGERCRSARPSPRDELHQPRHVEQRSSASGTEPLFHPSPYTGRRDGTYGRNALRPDHLVMAYDQRAQPDD
jgi:hypothetical protein